MNEAQLDFILAQASRDDPKALKFERRADIIKRMRAVNESTSRANVLTGRALDAMKAKVSFKLPEQYTMKPKATRRAAKEPATKPPRTGPAPRLSRKAGPPKA